MSATARKLSDADVAAIRASTETLRALAARYGVSFSTIRNARTREYKRPCGACP